MSPLLELSLWLFVPILAAVVAGAVFLSITRPERGVGQ